MHKERPDPGFLTPVSDPGFFTLCIMNDQTPIFCPSPRPLDNVQRQTQYYQK